MNPLLKQEPVRRLLRQTQVLAGKERVELFVVGGMIRDALAGRKKDNPDVDFALKAGALGFARRFASAIGAGFVALDEEHGTGRAVKKLPGGKLFTLDFSDFKGNTIEEDLGNRDFTVNAMAVPLDRLCAGAPLAGILRDPYGGRKDLSRGIVRMVSPRVFDDDPLRVLRAFSTAAILGGSVEKETLRLAGRKRQLLTGVSAERVRDEIFKIFSSGATARIIKELDAQGVMDILFPEIVPMKRQRQGPYHHLDVWAHTLETLAGMEKAVKLLARLEQVREYLDFQPTAGRSRRELLKFAAILHDIGKPATFRSNRGKVTFYGHDRLGASIAASVARRMRLSNDEERFIRRVVAMHLRPGFLATVQKVTAKALFRFFRDAGDEAGAVLILGQADLRATRGYSVVEETRAHHERLLKRLLREYFQRKECPTPPRIVNGNDLINLGLEPSPLLGRILRQLEELQAEGKIASKEEGLARARLLVKKAKTAGRTR